MRYQDPSLSPKERASALLPLLSSAEKLAQLVGWMPSRQATKKDIQAHCPLGIGQISTLEMRCMDTLEEAIAWQRTIQTQVMKNSPHGIPAIFHMEGVCGAFLQGAASFPSNIARGASWDTEQEEQIGRIVSRQERMIGITQTLAPVLDIARDPRLGRFAESYSEDPTLVSALGSAYARGVQEEDELPTRTDGVAKHFLASHHVEGGIHGAHADVPPRTLREIYGKPFQAAFTLAGLKGVMPCYCSLDGEPMSASHDILTKLLREEMGFDGVVVSDYSAISNIYHAQHAAGSISDAGKCSLAAGMDVELPNAEGFSETLLSDETLSSRLDEAVLRVLEAKFRMGLFEHPFALRTEQAEDIFDQEKGSRLARRAAEEGIVLLKNDGTLPLHKAVRKIAVIGCHASNARAFFGDYTHLSMASAVLAARNSIAGIGEAGTKGNGAAVLYPDSPVQSDETEEFTAVLQKQKPGQPSLLQCLKKVLPDCEILYRYGYAPHGGDTSRFEEALQAIREADLAILTLGGRYGSCSIATTGEGVDSTSINLPICQEQFIREAAKLGKPLIGVHLDGRPISSDAADENLSALLECWSLSEGGPYAVVDILVGNVNPSGKLPVSVPRVAGQIPVYYNHPWGSCWHQGESIGFRDYVNMSHYPRYPFGFGLSYTQFEYSNFSLSNAKTGPKEEIQVGITVKNTGDVPGTEIAQLYFSDLLASRARPMKELAGFARVTLKPGESRRVTWTFSPSQAAYLNREMEWLVETGNLEIQIGASSEDIRAQGIVRITEDAVIEGKSRCFFSPVQQQ